MFEKTKIQIKSQAS